MGGPGPCDGVFCIGSPPTVLLALKSVVSFCQFPGRCCQSTFSRGKKGSMLLVHLLFSLFLTFDRSRGSHVRFLAMCMQDEKKSYLL